MSFASTRDFWKFRRSVLRESRHIFSDEVEKFLDEVRATCEKRIKSLPPNKQLWRAQIGHSWWFDKELDDSRPCPYDAERMKPPPDKAREGRANPKGIPVLYLANKRETAVSEVRPWIGSIVSLAQFTTEKELRLVVCTEGLDEFPIYFEEPAPEEIEKAIWAEISKAFAEPVSPSDEVAEYAATQILAETFKKSGADGIVYKSNFGDEGHNIVLFDVNAVNQLSCSLVDIKKIAINISDYY
ncbi:MAG: RES family NAD+ phosphorylase [Rhodospirillales bacterium]|nr:RES family NAD+ phosphorylase [Rhodospirillales bacterium]